MEERIIQLETLSALQDQMLENLNLEIFQQQRDLNRLQQRIEMLENKLRELDQGNPIAGQEKPPHY